MTSLPAPFLPETVVEDLQSLVRFATVNPPGDEDAAAAWVVERLGSVGLDAEVLSSAGRPNVVARIQGDGSAGGPLLLTGHLDVVAVDHAHWTHDPFAGVIDQGYLWGRGTIDMKYMVVYCLHAMMALQASGRGLGRDVIFAAVSDEEAGCEHGSRFLVDRHPERVRATHMLGEFGGFSQDTGGVRYYPIQVGEKGVCQFRLRATGEPGHGSIPHRQNAVARLGRAVDRLGHTRLPRHRTAVVEDFVRSLAAGQQGAARALLPAILLDGVGDMLLDRLIPDVSVANTLHANLRHTAVPTMLQAGAQKNVIPSDAWATIDGRVLPGFGREAFLAEVEALIGRGYAYEILTWAPGRVNSDYRNDPVFQAICDNVRATDPQGVPVPYMLTGFTDAKEFGRLGMQCYGYAPVRFPAEDGIRFAKLVHGHNERIPLEGLRWGQHAFLRLIDRLTGGTLF
jgi:acetylornithine deacetylase/succinyl-diaminopimelate desuccinylase-like protein